MSDNRPVYGVTQNADLAPGLIHREIRPLRYRINDMLADAGGFMLVAGGVIVLMWPLFANIAGWPMIYDVLSLIGLLVWRFVTKRVRQYPFRRPKLPPGETGESGNGIAFLGNELGTGAGVWFSNDDLRTHMLVFGSTGSGKTRFLLGLLYQSLLMGSGCLYVDGKADNTVFWLVYSMCRRLGREDDLLIINYLTGGESIKEGDVSLKRLTNTNNPFAYGTAESMRSMIVGLMRDSGGDGDMWKGRASALIGALLKALAAMRDRNEINLDIEMIRNYMPLDKVVELAQRTDLPDTTIAPIKKYLLELPGYTEEDAIMGQINNKAYEQHAFLTMQLTEVMGDLSETYGHIFKAPLGEVDFKDVVFNRRILFVLLPSLEKDPDALAGLGKLVVAGVRSALAPALGNQLEGNKREVIDQKPTNSKVPFVMILDEYGYYAVKGFSVVAAQARSLGISVVFAGQDFPSFEKASKEEARSIVANTNIKIGMKLEDPKDTFDILEARGGDADVTQTSGFESKGGAYSDQRQARVERRKRINLRDLVSQKPGQAHVIFGDDVVRCQLYYTEPYEVPEAELNKFVMVSLPDRTVLDAMTGTFKRLDERFKMDLDAIGSEAGGAIDAEIEQLHADYRLARERGEQAVEAGVVAVGSIEWRALREDAVMQARAEGDGAAETPVAPTITLDGKGGDPKPVHNPQAVTQPDAREVLTIIDQAGSDADLEAAAADVTRRFSSILSDVVVSNHQRAAGKPMTPAERIESRPRQQLIEMEKRLGRPDGAAASEADRALDLLDERIEYPGEPVPMKRTQEEIHSHIEAMLARLKQKDSN